VILSLLAVGDQQVVPFKVDIRGIYRFALGYP
jgi:hypothetical protein